MIVPLSLSFSTDFDDTRQLLYSEYSSNWFSSFGRIPAALFSHDVRVRNTIHLGSKSAGLPQNMTTRLQRWFEAYRPFLLPTMGYAKFRPKLWKNRVPKIESQRLIDCFEVKLEKVACYRAYYITKTDQKQALLQENSLQLAQLLPHDAAIIRFVWGVNAPDEIR